MSQKVQFDETPNDGEETEAETVNDFKLIVDLSSESETESEMEDEQPNTENVDQPPSRERKQPVYYGREQSHLTTETPTTLQHCKC